MFDGRSAKPNLDVAYTLVAQNCRYHAGSARRWAVLYRSADTLREKRRRMLAGVAVASPFVVVLVVGLRMKGTVGTVLVVCGGVGTVLAGAWVELRMGRRDERR